MPKKTLLKQYRLCKRCLERHVSTGKSSRPCYICRGLMDNLSAIANNILAAVKGFEFDTFLIGATLSTQLYEREDTIRARLKIRGRANIKHYLTKELGIRLARLVGKKVEYRKPDITVTLTVDKENNVDLAVISRPIAFAGVYIKKSRGLPQRQDKCANCGGKGCNSCNYSGLSGYDSVEGIIAKELVRITRGQTPKFTWIGSEDQSSLVLGSGRPFYVRVFNPKKRKLKNKTIKGNGAKAMLKMINDIPVMQPRFTVKTKIYIRCENALTKKTLKKLSTLSGSKVSFKNKSKRGIKRIHSVRVRQLDSNQFILTIVADGGLMIKQLVGGEEYMKPNISEILGAKCECIMFDILNVQFQ
ncbi:MAG: tRNA pseudouridine(54/55) synthase Pus10 [Thermoproteota archaeon]|nr:tRNA pseudouridine(54/55) synthase Pus10 [Thermoproteota archaeon]